MSIPIKLFLASWNVGNAMPSAEELPNLLPSDKKKANNATSSSDYDVIVFGCQESTYAMQGGNGNMMSEELCIQDFKSKVMDTVGSNYTLVLIQTINNIYSYI